VCSLLIWREYAKNKSCVIKLFGKEKFDDVSTCARTVYGTSSLSHDNLVWKFPAFYGTRRVITVFHTDSHMNPFQNLL
jgi:hypothetical protein